MAEIDAELRASRKDLPTDEELRSLFQTGESDEEIACDFGVPKVWVEYKRGGLVPKPTDDDVIQPQEK